MSEIAINQLLPPLPTEEQIESLEAMALRLPDSKKVDLPLTHVFAPGVYWREMFAPKGAIVIGHKHKTEHLNVILSGAMIVLKDGVPTELKAPLVFSSPAGTRKVAYVTEDLRFVNVFPTAGLEHCGDNIKMLEDALREKSAAYLAYEKELKGITP